MSDNLLIVAGEPSGDALGGPLSEEISKIRPDIELWGFGGQKMASAGVEILTDVEELSFMGFTEVLLHLPAMFKRLDFLVKEAKRRKAVAAVLIDYPGFNLRLASKLSNNGIPVIYYVSPQIWAWKPKRIETIKRAVDKMLLILPFEEDIYRQAGVPAVFVGHPFLDSVVPSRQPWDFRKEHGLSEPLLLLLPGSRKQEVERLLSPMLGTFELLRKEFPGLCGIVLRASNLPKQLYSEAVEKEKIKVISDYSFDAMFASSAALCCSGSATLQCAVAGLPHIVTYKASALSLAIYKRVIRTKFVGLSNLVAAEQVAPELLQNNATPEKMADAVRRWLANPEERSRNIAELAKVKEKLGSPGAADRAAKEDSFFVGS